LPIKIDGTTQYINAAGNIVTLDKLDYIISDIVISGTSTVRVEHPHVHFIRRDTSMLLTYQIPAGIYNRISFTFGLNSERNQTGLYPNLFEMAWPNVPITWDGASGGGYHYLMLDGKWRNNANDQQPFRLHLGALEQIVHLDTIRVFSQTQQRDSIVGFDTITQRFHNFFEVSLLRDFTVSPHDITTVEAIIMDVKQWMENPYLWDFNVRGGGCIMGRRWAMDSLAQNGRSVFR